MPVARMMYVTTPYIALMRFCKLQKRRHIPKLGVLHQEIGLKKIRLDKALK